jgi:hypothetical protein
MLALSQSALGFSPVALAPRMAQRAATPTMETLGDLAELEQDAGVPFLGFWDPLGITSIDLYDFGEEGSIGWLRHAELKHGRVAMAGFVGFCVHANGIVFPWAITGGPLGTGDTTLFSDISAAGGPCDQWDAVPSAGKLQMLLTIALLEIVGETAKPHYTKGGKPGFYPSLKDYKNIPHPIPFELVDPFGLANFDGMDEATKAKKRQIEINNGRLAMIGIFGLISASKGLIVPGLDGLGLPQYEGEVMAFFSASDTGLPFVQQMLDGYTLF